MSKYVMRAGINRAYSQSLIDSFIAKIEAKPIEKKTTVKKQSMLEGTIRRAVTRTHITADNGKTFTDNFGRKYVYTVNGLIY